MQSNSGFPSLCLPISETGWAAAGEPVSTRQVRLAVGIGTLLKSHRVADRDLLHLGNVPRRHQHHLCPDVDPGCVGCARVVEEGCRGVDGSADGACSRPFGVVPLVDLGERQAVALLHL